MGSGGEKRSGGPIMLGSNLVLSQLLRQIVPRDHLLFSSTPNDQVQDQDSVSLSLSPLSL